MEEARVAVATAVAAKEEAVTGASEESEATAANLEEAPVVEARVDTVAAPQ